MGFWSLQRGVKTQNYVACQQALALGVDPDLIEANQREYNDGVRLQRISGQKIIPPPNKDALHMRGSGSEAVVEISICLDHEGVPGEVLFPHFSGCPGWNSRIFEAVRAWQHEVKGRAGNQPICTGVTFVYRPAR